MTENALKYISLLNDQHRNGFHEASLQVSVASTPQNRDVFSSTASCEAGHEAMIVRNDAGSRSQLDHSSAGLNSCGDFW